HSTQLLLELEELEESGVTLLLPLQLQRPKQPCLIDVLSALRTQELRVLLQRLQVAGAILLLLREVQATFLSRQLAGRLRGLRLLTHKAEASLSSGLGGLRLLTEEAELTLHVLPV